jgi:uncharacterized protein (TIGR03437 family)
MQHRNKLILNIPLLVVFAPLMMFAHAGGPDAALSGVPGESTCASCHGGGSGTGSVSVTFPNGATYTPGATQHLTVTVSDSKARRWGFQLTARQSSSSTAQAGTFTPTDGNTQIVCTQTTFRSESFGNSCSASLPLQYIEHTQAGTHTGTSGSTTYQFDWTPPSSNVGSIIVYVAGNGANGDGSERGDTIHTAKFTVTPAQSNSPTITSVVNGASFQPGIAPGSWVTINGTNLAASTRTWRAAEIVNGQLPTSLDNVSVTINGTPAAVYYISPTQINVQAPDVSATGPVSIQVTNNGATGGAFSGTLQRMAPALFLWSGKYPVATHYPDNAYVGPAGLFGGSPATNPAKPGDVIVLWGTGLGPTTPVTVAGWEVATAEPLANAPVVTIGGVPAQVIGAAISPGAAGLYQISMTVPEVPDGDQLITVQVAGVKSPAGVYLTIQH